MQTNLSEIPPTDAFVDEFIYLQSKHNLNKINVFQITRFVRFFKY